MNMTSHAKSRINDDNKLIDVIKRHYNSQIEVWKVSDSVFKLRDQSSDIYYAKQYKRERSQILKKLSNIHDDIGMPKSNVIDDDALIQIMEPAAGKHLGKYLAYWMLPGVWNYLHSKIKKIFFDFGEQVGRLHSLTEGDEDLLEMNDLRLDMHDAIVNCNVSSHLEHLFDDRVLNKLNKNIQYFDKYCAPTSIIHGDLMLFHVYISGSNVSIIDFGAAWRSHPFEDIATFTTALDLYIRRLPYTRSTQREQISNKFFEGYKNTNPLDNFDYDLFINFQLIRYCSLLSYYTNGNCDDYFKSKLLKKVDVPIIRQSIHDIISDDF